MSAYFCLSYFFLLPLAFLDRNRQSVGEEAADELKSLEMQTSSTGTTRKAPHDLCRLDPSCRLR